MITYISYFTENTPYEEVIKSLEVSLQKFSLPYKFYSRPSLKDWDKNARQKAEVIGTALRELRSPVVWLDADAEVNQEPVLFNTIKEDFGSHIRNLNGFSFFTCTLFFNYTPASLWLVDEWRRRCESGERINPRIKLPEPYKKISPTSSIADQGPLANAYWEGLEAGKTVSLFELPKSYAVKIDSKHLDRVIVQNQASRKFKKVV